MATAAPSPLASSVEKTNGAKLSRLLIDGGTTVLKNLFDHYHPPSRLATNLNSHYSTLNGLFRDGHLHTPQWYKLFPTGGAIPDSKNFDISLLFLLLTNICGLSPPRGGWHREPHTRDHSREANLARIKFFRNELYGHVTTTGIDTPTFNALWRKINGALRGLGLDKASIDRLKQEHGGEEDYINVLCEWSVSEQDIKSQLEDISQSQTEVQQAVNEVRLTQLEDRKILQDSKKKLEEVHKVQTETQQTVDEVRQSQTKTQQTVDEVRQSQTKTQRTVDEVRQSQIKTQQTVDEVRHSQFKTQQTVDEERQSQIKTQQTVDEVRQSQIKTQQTVDEVRQSQIKTQQTVDEVRQNQLEDRGTLQYSNAKLQEVCQIDRKTHQVVTNVRETQIDDSKVIQEIRHTQHECHKTLQETKTRVDEIQQTHEKLLGTQGLEGQNEKHRENEILKKLAKIDTLKNVRHHGGRYIEGTRLSIFAKVESWLDDRSCPNRVMVISGNAGMGKSVISAVVCKKMQEAGRLAGSHFCQHDRVRHRNSKVMLQSLASHLCDVLPEYKKALVEKLSRNLGVEINNMEVKDLFDVLFEEPLTSLNDSGLTYLMVIDGLDESEFQGRNELLDVIANYFQNLPLWIRFLVTTRPERNIAETLKNLHPLQLDPNVEENLKDIHLCFDKQLSHLLQSEYREDMLQALVQKSEGDMLYTHYLVDFIKREVSFVSPELLDSILPSSISSVYQSYFKRLETELCKELKVTEDQFLDFLHALAAAREPLPLGFVSKLLLPVKSTSVTQGKVNVAIACVSALLPVQNECVHFFHKSVKDWLIEESKYRHAHFIEKGHEVLSELCIDELDEVKRKGVDCAHFSDTTKYTLRHGVQHMLQLENARVCSLEDVVTKFVLDLELVYAKLCVNVTAASEDIVCVQKHVGIEELQRALNTLLVLLRKHIATLGKLPHTIFQTLLNEGEPEMSSEALNLLETKYSEMPYLEYLDKEDLQWRVPTKFHCSAAVACFDVSPQLDYMVCECDDNTIQLWSLHTGKQLWKRDVKVKKDTIFGSQVYRLPRNFYPNVDDNSIRRVCIPYIVGKTYPPATPKSLYRSVVFHPTEDFVLPGILSHAYTFDGDLKPLFLSSKCRFSVCSISVDKIKMLSDCPNDAKSIIMWSLTDGSEINRFSWSDDIASFAWSRDGRLLAISDLSGSIGLLDVMDDYRNLAQTTVSEACGMIKFSPDCRLLYCLVLNSVKCDLFRLDVNMEKDSNFSFDVLPAKVSYQPWKFESCSEKGFLLGDPFCLPPERDTILLRTPALAFVLNEQSLLTVTYDRSIIEMLHIDEVTKDSAGVSKTIVKKAVLSLNGHTLFIITTTDGYLPTLMAWDISSGMCKARKRVFGDTGRFGENIVAVREGVLLEGSHDTLELWNFELSECIRSWTDLKFLMEVIPISEERVACQVWCPEREVERKLIIVDTTREGIVSTFTFLTGEFFAACNSECHVLTAVREELKMQSGDKVLWKMPKPTEAFLSRVIFSPTEQYCILRNVEVLVLDAVLGKTLHKLYPGKYNDPFNGKWIAILLVTRSALSASVMNQTGIFFSCLMSSLVTC